MKSTLFAIVLTFCTASAYAQEVGKVCILPNGSFSVKKKCAKSDMMANLSMFSAFAYKSCAIREKEVQASTPDVVVEVRCNVGETLISHGAYPVGTPANELYGVELIRGSDATPIGVKYTFSGKYSNPPTHAIGQAFCCTSR